MSPLTNHAPRLYHSTDSLLQIRFLTDCVFLNPTACTKLQKNITQLECLGSLPSHDHMPPKESRFANLGGVFDSFFSSKIFGFFLLLGGWDIPPSPKKIRSFSCLSFNEETKNSSLKSKLAILYLNKNIN